MSIAFKLPRSTRRTDYIAADGQRVFGPAPWLAFDPADVRVRLKAAGTGGFVTLTTGYSVSLSASPTGFAIVTFDADRAKDDIVRVEGARVHPRVTDVTRAGSVQTAAMERELDTQSATLQELRRDVDEAMQPSVDLQAAVVAAQTAAGVSVGAAGNAQAAYGSFRDRYLLPATALPVVDDDGDPLQIGTLIELTGQVDPADNGLYVYRADGWGKAAAVAAAQVPFDDSTAGLGAGTVQAALNELAARMANLPTEVLRMTAFGAAPGVVVDASAGIQAAINACPAGGIVDGGGLSYRVDSQLTGKSKVRIRNARLVFANAAKNASLFRAQGADGASVAITGGAARYSNSFTVASTAGLSVGQYIRIRSSDAFENNTNAAEGEFARVLGISGSTVTLRDGLHANYSTSPVFYKPTFVEEFELENVKAVGGGVLQNGAASSGHYAVRLELGLNCRFINCSFDLFDTDNIELSKCCRTWVVNSGMTRTYDGGAPATSGGESYGVAVVNGSMWTYVLGCYFEDMRHPIMTGGVEGVVRYLIADGNIMNGCRAAGMDTHPAADMIHFCNNIISASIGAGVSTSSKNGIQHFGGTAVICNNIIRGTYDGGITCQIWAKNRPVSLTISGNQIEHGSGGGAAIYVECSNTPSRLESVTISGNAARDGFTRGAYIVMNSADIYHFAVAGNTFGLLSGPVVEITGGSGRLCEIGTISNNTGRHSGSGSGCIELNANSGTIQRIAIDGNSLFGGSHGVRGSASGVDRLAVTGNIFNAWATAATANLGANSVIGTNVTA